MSQSNALSNQLSNHDTSIKSLLNDRGCIKSVQVVDTGLIYEGRATGFEISAVNMKKTILLTEAGAGCSAVAQLISSTVIHVTLSVFHYEHQTGTQQGSAIIQVVEFY